MKFTVMCRMVYAGSFSDGWEHKDYDIIVYLKDPSKEVFYKKSVSAEYFQGLFCCYLNGLRVSKEEFEKALITTGSTTTCDSIRARWETPMFFCPICREPISKTDDRVLFICRTCQVEVRITPQSLTPR